MVTDVVFWFMTSCRLEGGYEVSNKRFASIFRVDDTLLRNINNYTASQPRKDNPHFHRREKLKYHTVALVNSKFSSKHQLAVKIEMSVSVQTP
jgi:hypothetical protein